MVTSKRRAAIPCAILDFHMPIGSFPTKLLTALGLGEPSIGVVGHWGAASAPGQLTVMETDVDSPWGSESYYHPKEVGREALLQRGWRYLSESCHVPNLFSIATAAAWSLGSSDLADGTMNGRAGIR